MVAPGVTTMDLEKAAERLIAELGAVPAFKDTTVILVFCVLRSMRKSYTASVGQAGAENGRHRFHRLRSGPRRLLRRRRDHGAGGREADRGTEEAARSDEASLYKGIEQVKIGNTVDT